mgnify:CR=1 FL=1
MNFGTKQRRFDAKLELKEYFNRDPGPGAYAPHRDMDEEQRSENVSTKGYMNGFVSNQNRFKIFADMLTADPNIDTAPG